MALASCLLESWLKQQQARQKETHELGEATGPAPVSQALVRKSLHTALVFRNAVDGSAEEAKELALECGGEEADVSSLLQLWALSEG